MDERDGGVSMVLCNSVNPKPTVLEIKDIFNTFVTCSK